MSDIQTNYSSPVTMEAVDVAAAFILYSMKYSSSSSSSSLSPSPLQTVADAVKISAAHSTPVVNDSETDTASDSEIDDITVTVTHRSVRKRKARVLNADFEDDEETSDGFNGNRFNKSPKTKEGQPNEDSSPSFPIAPRSIKYWKNQQKTDAVKRLRRHLIRDSSQPEKKHK